jgi:hypothetical protein
METNFSYSKNLATYEFRHALNIRAFDKQIFKDEEVIEQTLVILK